MSCQIICDTFVYDAALWQVMHQYAFARLQILSMCIFACIKPLSIFFFLLQHVRIIYDGDFVCINTSAQLCIWLQFINCQ